MEPEEKNHQRKLTCRSVSCLFLAIIFLCCALITIITISRPPSIWSSFVKFNNKDVILQKDNQISLEDGKEHIEGQITGIGENVVSIDEQYLTALARSSFEQLTLLTIEVEEGIMNIYWAVDTSVEDYPLIAQVQLSLTEEDELIIDKVGTPAFKLPKAANQALTSAVLAVLNFQDGGESENKNLLSRLLAIDNDTDIKEIEFKENMIELIINVNVSLYD